IIDVTERERAEKDRLEAEEERQRLLGEEESLRSQSEAKDRFLATLSHELRTPLTPILFALSGLESRGLVSAEERSAFDMVRRNVEIEARLIDDLLDTTRIARGKLHMQVENVDLHPLLDDVLAMCANELETAGLQIWSQSEAWDHHVQGDPTRLRQGIWNLVNNAIRYTPAGGRIAIRSKNPSAGWIRVLVEDTGKGIDVALLERLFSPFEQGNDTSLKTGLGLGLAISKGIVEAHGGHIRARSLGRGRGACFEFELPTVDPARVNAVESGKPV